MPKLTLSFKGRVLDVFHLDQGETLVGRNDDCAITIDSLAIAPVHASFRLNGEECQLQALDQEFPILVNHNQTASTRLEHGDVVQLGKHTLSYAEDAIELAGDLKSGPDGDAAPPEQPEEEAEETTPKGMLQITSVENFGRIIPLTRNMTRIGRVGGDCAIISRRDSGYYLSYLEGPNPPRINSQEIADGGQLLHDGDNIKVGKTEMQFHI